jgi:hypothetical protein
LCRWRSFEVKSFEQSRHVAPQLREVHTAQVKIQRYKLYTAISFSPLATRLAVANSPKNAG